MRRGLAKPPADLDVKELGRRVKYVGSPEHKSYKSFAGPPKLRSDASRCDPSLSDPGTLTKWLRKGLVDGNVGAPWEGDFPRYVWHLHGGRWYEARLVNRESGEYKGYPIDVEELPKGLP